jgi:hypothetical protein
MSNACNNAVKGAIIKLILSLAFVAIGVWVVYLAVEMVGIFGEGMGADERSRLIYSRAHIAVHLFGTASSLAVGLFLMDKSKVLGVTALLAIIFCGCYGIVNMIGFTTTNRLSVAESRSAANSAEWKKYENARAALQGTIDWAHKTIIEEGSPREKTRLRNYIDQKTRELNALEPPKPAADKVLADPQATWFSKLTGFGTEAWQLALPVPVGVLLFIAEVLSFVFAMHLFTAALDGFQQSRITPKDSASGGGRKNIRVIDGNAAGNNSPAKEAMQAASNEYSGMPPDAQRSKMSDDELREYLHKHAKGLMPKKTQHQMVLETGWSQPSISRKTRQVRYQEGRLARKAARNLE